eukprot:scaffold2.g6910.t1
MHAQFESAVAQLGGAASAAPKAILALIQDESLTLFHVKSKLQKHRAAEKDRLEGKPKRPRGRPRKAERRGGRGRGPQNEPGSGQGEVELDQQAGGSTAGRATGASGSSDCTMGDLNGGIETLAALTSAAGSAEAAAWQQRWSEEAQQVATAQSVLAAGGVGLHTAEDVSRAERAAGQLEEQLGALKGGGK